MPCMWSPYSSAPPVFLLNDGLGNYAERVLRLIGKRPTRKVGRLRLESGHDAATLCSDGVSLLGLGEDNKAIAGVHFGRKMGDNAVGVHIINLEIADFASLPVVFRSEVLRRLARGGGSVPLPRPGRLPLRQPREIDRGPRRGARGRRQDARSTTGETPSLLRCHRLCGLSARTSPRRKDGLNHKRPPSSNSVSLSDSRG